MEAMARCQGGWRNGTVGLRAEGPDHQRRGQTPPNNAPGHPADICSSPEKLICNAHSTPGSPNYAESLGQKLSELETAVAQKEEADRAPSPDIELACTIISQNDRIQKAT